MDKILDKLNDKQQEAVNYTDGPLLIFAGAGSGKTKVLTHKIAHLLDKKKTTPSRILAVTFTNKAAKEMKIRVKKLLGAKANLVNIGTFHSINARIMRTDRKFFAKDFTIYDSNDSLQIIKESIKALGIQNENIKPKSVRHFISLAKQQLATPDRAKNYFEDNFINEQNVLVYAEYEKRLKENNAVDFDDLLMKPIVAFQKHKELKEKYQNKWDYILVDEYQDTNRVQFLFLKIISEIQNNICAVGDDDQSIYKWRGADIKNILEFEKTFKNAKVIKLEQNYRSTKNILLAASSVVGNNSMRKSKKIWSDSVEGDRIILQESDSDYAEAEYIAMEISQKIKQGKEFKDFAILYRTNAQSRLIEDALRNKSIRYTIIGGTKFYDRKEVKDILAYLNVITNFNDSLGLKRVINTPSRGLGKTTIDRLEEYSIDTQKTLFEALDYSDEAEVGYAKVKLELFKKTMLDYKKQMKKYSPTEFVKKLIDEMKFREQYQDDNEQDDDKIANIDELINSVIQFEKTHKGATIVNFLQEVSLISDIDQWEDENNVVVLMTLHSAKGLEFPTVFIAGLEEGLFPLERSKENRQELEEERRLLYVGITRAMKNVYLLNAKRRNRFGQFAANMPSRFIDEIPEECLIREEKYISIRNNYDAGYKKKSKKYYHINKKQDGQSILVRNDIIKKNDFVQHKIFGKGRVIGISKSSQIAYKIIFNDQSVKTIAKKFVTKINN